MIQISSPQLKKMLVEDGVITADKFDQALTQSKRMNQSLVDVLASQGFVTSDYYYNLLAKYFGVERVNFQEIKIDEGALRLLPENTARERNVIIFGWDADGALHVAMTDPSDLNTIEFLEKHLNTKIRPFLATDDDLNRGFVMYGKQSADDFKRQIEEMIQASIQARVQEKDDKAAAHEVPIVSMLDHIISYAVSLSASDVHLEALEEAILVRYRIDGILHEVARLPKSVLAPLSARVKLLSGLRLDEHAKPQDGRFRQEIGNSFIDIRVSVIPTFYGEKVELRLLTSAARPLSLRELGILGGHDKTINDVIHKAYGLLLVTGPTGSGKTTTLYSLLSIVNQPEVNIVTIEDPIEYNMKYINQTQVNQTMGITFASGLRSILRQDPDIILVGEIRDEETAEIAVNSALTGHRVFSSLHTNDAPTAIPRLIDMKMPPFLVSAVLNAVLAQRLVRKICLRCIISYEPDSDTIEMIRTQFMALGIEGSFVSPKTLFRAAGCDSCGSSGYKGRVGIFELLDVDEEVRELIVNPDFSLERLRTTLRAKGFRTMFEDGFEKARIGITTIDEVMRVIRE
jgi:type IV pilus assembly protein PilB